MAKSKPKRETKSAADPAKAENATADVKNVETSDEPKPKRGKALSPAEKALKLLEQGLSVACYAGDVAAAKAIIDTKPELAENWNPIQSASFAGAADIVALLLKNGADANCLSQTSQRFRPLHRACEYKRTVPRGEKHADVVHVLLKAGADPTIRGGWYKLTPLAMAAEAGSFDLVEALLPAMDKLDIYHAASVGDDERVAELLAGESGVARERDVNGMTALMYAGASRLGLNRKLTARALEAIAGTLIKAGADVNAILPGSERPPTVATFAVANPAILRLLLEAGADPRPALINALWSRDLETAELLVEYGADVKDPHIAGYVGGFAHWGNFHQSRWLIEHGSPVDAVDKYNDTALQAAAQRGAAPDFVEFLLEHNADVLKKNDEGDTPLETARKKKRLKLIPLLEKAAERADIAKPGRDTTEDDAFEADLPTHMRSKRPKRK